VCDIPVAKQNFRQRHGHGLIDTSTTKETKQHEYNGIDGLSSAFRNLPVMDEKELECFFEWIQNDENVF
jgi:hypothetical protein